MHWVRNKADNAFNKPNGKKDTIIIRLGAGADSPILVFPIDLISELTA